MIILIIIIIIIIILDGYENYLVGTKVAKKAQHNAHQEVTHVRAFVEFMWAANLHPATPRVLFYYKAPHIPVDFSSLYGKCVDYCELAVSNPLQLRAAS